MSVGGVVHLITRVNSAARFSRELQKTAQDQTPKTLTISMELSVESAEHQWQHGTLLRSTERHRQTLRSTTIKLRHARGKNRFYPYGSAPWQPSTTVTNISASEPRPPRAPYTELHSPLAPQSGRRLPTPDHGSGIGNISRGIFPGTDCRSLFTSSLVAEQSSLERRSRACARSLALLRTKEYAAHGMIYGIPRDMTRRTPYPSRGSRNVCIRYGIWYGIPQTTVNDEKNESPLPRFSYTVRYTLRNTVYHGGI